MLNKVGAGSSDRVVEIAESSCKRQSEINREYPLEAVITNNGGWVLEGNERNLTVQVSNTGEDVVTLFSLNHEKTGEWTFDNWIEPGRWVEVEIAVKDQANEKPLQSGVSLDGKTLKVIPTK